MADQPPGVGPRWRWTWWWAPGRGRGLTRQLQHWTGVRHPDGGFRPGPRGIEQASERVGSS